jgi:hypothetical protein
MRIRIPNTALVLAQRWNLPVGRISQPELGSRPEDFSIYLPRIMELARANGDLEPPSGRDGEGSTEEPAASPLPPPVSPRASRLEERILTVGQRSSEPANVVDVSDSDDDLVICIPLLDNPFVHVVSF